MKRETDNKVLTFKHVIEYLNFCVYEFERITNKLFSDLSENIVLSGVGYEIGADNDNEKAIPYKKPVIMR